MDSDQKKNLFAVVALALIAFLSPDVRGAIFQSMAINSGAQVAAVAATCPPNSTCINSVSALIVGTPTLSITYDKKNESAIVASFVITVNGGSDGVNIYKSNPQYYHLTDQNGVSTYPSTGMIVTPVSSANIQSGIDSNGNMYYHIGPGGVLNFNVVISIAPTQFVFGGNYYATLEGINANSSTNFESFFKILVPANQTNTKVIVGETGPFVSKVVSGYYLVPGSKVTFQGYRLQKVDLSIDGIKIKKASLDINKNGTEGTFVLPESLSLGSHYFTLDDNKSIGNRLSFQAISAGQIIVSGISPWSGLPGDQITIYGYGFNSNSVTKWSGPATAQDVTPSSLSSDGTQLVVNVPSVPAGDYNVSVSNSSTGVVSSSISFNVSGPTVVCPTSYICTPPNQTVACPAGYTCTPTTVNCPSGYSCYTTTVTTSNCYTFTTNLVVGSTGADVVALQTLLIAHGFDIPNITSGSVAKGVYDQQTADAVSRYQASVGLPSTGFVGPLTRAALNSCPIVIPSLGITNLLTTYGSKIVANSGTTTQSFTFTFSITAGNDPVYISKTAATALSTTNSNSSVFVDSLDFSAMNTAGDGPSYFYVAPGQTKNFIATYAASAMSSSASTVFQVNSINYGSNTVATGFGIGSTDVQNSLKAVLFH